MAGDIRPGRGILGLRGLLAVLLGVIGFFMVVLAFLMPRTTTVLIVQFFAVYVLLDGLLCMTTGARASKPSSRFLLILEGLVEVGTGIAAFVLIGGLGEGPKGRILLLMALWAIAVGVLELAWGLTADIRRGRPLLLFIAVVSVAFGLFVLTSMPPDLLTAVWRLAVYVLLIGVLRTMLSFRLQGS